MNIYEKNIEALKEARKFFYEKILEVKEYSEIVNIIAIPTKCGNTTMVVETENMSYRLNSSYCLQNEAERWCKQYKFISGENIICLYGLGNGYFAREILKNMKEGNKFLVYEPSSEVFQFVLKHYDITDLIREERCVIAVDGINGEDFEVGLSYATNIMNVKNILQCCHSQYDKLFGKQYIEFINIIKVTVSRASMNARTTKYFSEVDIVNLCSNLQYLRESSALKEIERLIPKDATAVLVAAGPSVKENIEVLRKAKGRTIIFAVDKILDYLLDEGIEPDFVCSLDSLKDIKNFSCREKIEVPLLHFTRTNPVIMDLHKGKKILCNSMGFLNDIFEKMDKEFLNIRANPSVATMAFLTIATLGIKRVILVGQDLSFGKDGNMYTGKDKRGTQEETEEYFVEGIDGGKVRSRRDWEFFLDWYRTTLYALPEVEAIDVKSYGAKIPGTKNMSFEEALEFCTEENVWNKEKEKQILPIFSDEEWNEVMKLLEEKVDELYRLKRECKNGQERAEKVLIYCKKNRSLDASMKKEVQKISKIIDKVENSFVPELLGGHIEAYAGEALININDYSDDEQENNIRTYEYTKSMLKALETGICFMEPLLKESIVKLKEA